MVDMFSGRPNPSWETTDTEAGTITAVLDELIDSERIRRAPGREGYRGFLIEDPGRLSITVRGTSITVRTETSIRAKSDPDRTLEQALLDMSRRQLPPQEYEALIAQTRAN
ncbi:hypothetical protein [Nocardia bovistercoris]|uniref:Uncharacterized protein n=1 Tax=Nocardia bovistercoris TaxID=2785916 RepID=A0A931IFJ2_9NOCA|nr:hypothetical protein [Nocardia bovistercoris]MBH0780792.1 hypothetical protein [Nocardia bovistercoris]